MPAARERLVFALDVPDRARALELVDQLQAHVGCFKVGLELFIAEGPELVREVAARAPVFLDLKLHDIPATVGRAAAAAGRLGVRYLTVHPGEAAVRAAVEAAPDVGILLVTVLTSIGPAELGGQSVQKLVCQRAWEAEALGCRGVVCSGQEAAAVRAAVGGELLIVTPGIRPAGAAAGDQQRVMTPAQAVGAGADLIVVGRPIRDAADPAGAAQAVVAEIGAAG